MNVFQKIWTEIKFQWQVDCVYITINKERRHDLSELKSQIVTASDELIKAIKQQNFAKKQKTRQCAENTNCLGCVSANGCDICSEYKSRMNSTECPYKEDCTGVLNDCLVPKKQDEADKAVIEAKKKYNAAVIKYVDYKQNKR